MRDSPDTPRLRRPSQGWERDVNVITLAVFIAFTGFTIVVPFLPLYVRQLGVTDERSVAIWSGLIFGVSPLLAGIMAPLWGSVADRYGRKPMFVRSLVAFTVVMFLTGLATSVVQVFILRLLAGVFGGFGATAMALVTTSAPEDRASGAIGRLQAAMMLTNVSGPLLGGVLASTLGIRNTFFVSTAMYVLALGAVVVFFQESKREEAGRKTRERLPLRSVLFLPTVLPLAGILLLSQFAHRGLNPILPLYVEQLGTDPRSVPVWAGVLTSAGAVASALAAAAAGRLGGRMSLRSLLFLTLAGGLAGSVVVSAVQNVAQLLAAYALLGLLAGGSVTLVYSIGSKRLPMDSRGASFGLLSTGSMVGGGLSPFVAGLVAAASLRFVFLLAAALYAFSAAFTLWLPAERAARRSDAEVAQRVRP